MVKLNSKIKTYLGDKEIATKFVVVWKQLFAQLAKTDYQFDRIFWHMNIGYPTFYLGPVAPDDLSCLERPFFIQFDVKGIEEAYGDTELDDEIDKIANRLHREVKKWLHKGLKTSWKDAEIKKAFSKLEWPHEKLGVYIGICDNAAKEDELNWVCAMIGVENYPWFDGKGGGVFGYR